MSARPLVGVTTRIAQAQDGSLHPNVAPYVHALERAGARVRILENDPASVDAVLSECAAVVLSGGGDVDPEHYGAARDPKTEAPNPVRDAFEIALVRAARERRIPTLCICRGLQVANVAFGGTLIQHLPDAPGVSAAIEHSQTEVYALNREEYAPGHRVTLREGSALRALLGVDVFETNSMHHQAVERPAAGFAPVAWTAEGVIEALEPTFEHPYFVAVQWHPEALPASDAVRARLFEGLVAAALAPAERKSA